MYKAEALLLICLFTLLASGFRLDNVSYLLFICQSEQLFAKMSHPLRNAINDPKSTSGDYEFIYEETFEEEVPLKLAVNMQTITKHGFTVEFDTVFKGHKAGRFELRKSDPLVHHGKRSELFVTRRTTDKERWYSYAVYFPSKDFAYDSKSDVISQWWQTSGSTQATSLRVRKEQLILRTGNNADSLKEICLGPVPKDSWQQFVFHFIHSYDSDGLIEIWRNGEKILENRGGNMYDTKMPYWKIGIYKAAWNKGKTDTSKRVLFYDNIRVGDKDAKLSSMISGN